MTEAELIALAERYYKTVRFELHTVSMSQASWDRLVHDYSSRRKKNNTLGAAFTFEWPLQSTLNELLAGRTVAFMTMRGAVRISLDATLPEGTCCVLNEAGDVIEEIRTPKE